MILVIKVLDYSGYGTHYDIAEGLNRAASNASVKVINLSFGGPQSSLTLQNAINNAVNVKNKLVVASAGDDGTTAMNFPAAYSRWAEFAGKVLAVGAQGRYMTPSSGVAPNPRFVEYCQAVYSNYGTWIDIVAPGTDIWSTTPYKKDFFRTRYGDSTSGYNPYDGTSMAAAYVSAAAARVWSVNSTFTNVQVAQRLLGDGSPALKVRTGQVDIDGDTINDGICWDAASADAGSGGRRLDLVDLDFAMATQRSAITGYLYDAYNGLSLAGAVVTATCGAYKPAAAPIGSSGSYTEKRYTVLNAPWTATPCSLSVNKGGYTSGPIVFGNVTVNSSSIWFQARDVAVPPLSNSVTFVTNWGAGGPASATSYVELNQHVLFPVPAVGASPATRCDVGLGTPDGDGLALDPALWCGTGTLLAQPYTRWMFSTARSKTPDPNPTWTPLETTASKYLNSSTTQPYNVFVVDQNQGSNLSDAVNGWPVTRVWRNGIIKATVTFGASTGIQGRGAAGDPAGTLCSVAGGAADCHIWHVGNLSYNGIFTPVNQLRDSTVLPF